MACIVLKQPKKVPSTEAAHAALLFAHVAWNRTLTVRLPDPDCQLALRKFEASNPNFWNELTSSDAEALIYKLVAYKQARYNSDRRRVVVCGMRGGNVHVEWTEPES